MKAFDYFLLAILLLISFSLFNVMRAQHASGQASAGAGDL